MVVFEQSGCIREKWLFSGKSRCIRVKVVVFGKSGCNWAKCLYLGKSRCIRAKIVVFGQKMVVFLQSVVIRQKWL